MTFKDLSRKLVVPLIAGSLALGVVGCGRDLTPQDFAKARWIEYDNQENFTYGAYLNENITHNRDNLLLWSKEVPRYNQERNRVTKGRMFLPDLDGNGAVGN